MKHTYIDDNVLIVALRESLIQPQGDKPIIQACQMINEREKSLLKIWDLNFFLMFQCCMIMFVNFHLKINQREPSNIATS